MSKPTAAALVERLRSVYEEREGRSLSDEKLAGRLPISLSTLNRWKTGDTEQFQAIVEMLDIAGWLTVTEDATTTSSTPADPLERIAASLDALVRGQNEVLEIVQQLAGAPPSPPPGTPKVTLVEPPPGKERKMRAPKKKARAQPASQKRR